MAVSHILLVLCQIVHWILLELPEKITGSGLRLDTGVEGARTPSIYCTHHPLKILLESHLWIEIPVFLPLWLSWFYSFWSVAGLEQTEEPFQSNDWFFFWSDPKAGRIHSYSKELWVLWEASSQTSQSLCCYQSPFPHPEPFQGKNWSFPLLLTREFWQGCPEQVSVIFLCQVLTGQAALGFYFLPSAGYCREKKHKYSTYFKQILPYLPFLLGLSFLLLKFRKGWAGRTGMDSHPPSLKILLGSCLGIEIQVILPLWFNCYSSSDACSAAGIEFRVRGALKSNAWWFCLKTLNIYNIFCDRMSQLNEHSTSLSAVQPELFSSSGFRTELTPIIQFLPTQSGIPTLPTFWEYSTIPCPHKNKGF